MKYFIIDAFTTAPFTGNPAGVCLVDRWPEAKLMQKIAGENRLPETAFICKGDKGWGIRWFTPSFEMDLCGHATLASGFVILNILEPADQVELSSPSGPLRVQRENDLYTLDFPARPPVEVSIDPRIETCLGVPVRGCFQSRDLIVLVDNEAHIKHMKPDFDLMAEIVPEFGMVPTAAGEHCDFVSRYFDPHDAIIEDPVTGSAHCTLIPFWKDRLHKTEFTARQLSARGGTLYCRDAGARVKISGSAVLYLQGELNL